MLYNKPTIRNRRPSADFTASSRENALYKRRLHTLTGFVSGAFRFLGGINGKVFSQLMRGSSTVRCKKCDAVLGNRVGHYLVSAWSHKECVFSCLSFVVCGACGCEWSPLPINQRDARPVELIAAGCRRLLCPKEGCGKTIAFIGEGVAGVQHHRRVIVARELLLVSCVGCGTLVEPPFLLDIAIEPQRVSSPDRKEPVYA